jgi:hypothetical protein
MGLPSGEFLLAKDGAAFGAINDFHGSAVGFLDGSTYIMHCRMKTGIHRNVLA